MPLFRRRTRPEGQRFSVGVDGHEVVVGGGVSGCRLFDDLEGYVGVIAKRHSTTADGRDSIAVQNAKMDYAEMADAAVTVVTLALEDLVEQGVLEASDVPKKPEFKPLPQDLSTYDYIQTTFQRAERRLGWVRQVDELFRQREIALIKPVM